MDYTTSRRALTIAALEYTGILGTVGAAYALMPKNPGDTETGSTAPAESASEATELNAGGAWDLSRATKSNCFGDNYIRYIHTKTTKPSIILYTTA